MDNRNSRGSQMNRRVFLGRAGLVGAGALVAPGVLAACGSSSKSTASNPGGTKAGGGSVGAGLVVGSLRPLTGLLASSYSPLYMNAQLALQEINAAGGILGKPLSLKNVDDTGSPAGEPQAVKQLQSDGIRFVIGPTGDSNTEAALAVLTVNKMISCGFVQSDFAGDASKYPYSYHPYFDTTEEGDQMAQYMVQQLGIKKVAYLEENSALGQNVLGPMKATLAKYGATLVSTQEYSITDNNFEPFVTNMRNAGAQGIIATLGNVPNTVSFYNALIQVGWFPPTVSHAAPLLTAVTSKTWPSELLKNVYCATLKNYSYPANGQPPQTNVAFVNKLKQIPGFSSGGSPSAPFYDFLKILAMVINDIKSTDVSSVKKALDGVRNYAGMNGTITFTPTNHNGIGISDCTIVTAASASDPRSMGGYFFQQAPGL